MPSSLPIRLILVEDDPRLLGMLAEGLASYSDFEILSSHGSAEDALASADWERCTILLTDLSLPGLGGVELIRRAKTSRPDLIAAAYTVNDQQQEVLGAIRAGASGYILKRESLHGISAAITELASGGAPITPSVACMILDALRDSDQSSQQLSPKELQILVLVSDGYLHKEIAGLLGVSLHTVHSHTKRIYKKLGAKGRLEALEKARLSGQL
jgi:DNA-binding NarL/FixJ family response regulator